MKLITTYHTGFVTKVDKEGNETRMESGYGKFIRTEEESAPSQPQITEAEYKKRFSEHMDSMLKAGGTEADLPEPVEMTLAAEAVMREQLNKEKSNNGNAR